MLLLGAKAAAESQQVVSAGQIPSFTSDAVIFAWAETSPLLPGLNCKWGAAEEAGMKLTTRSAVGSGGML